MKIQLKRSSVLESNKAKAPSSGQMEYGELAVNFNQDDPAIFIKDSNDHIIRIAGIGNIADDGLAEVPSGSAPPSNPVEGNLWFNDEDGRLYIYYVDADSSQWVDASPDSYDPSIIPDVNDPNYQPGTLDDRYNATTVSETPPNVSVKNQGSLWWNSSDSEGKLYVLYDDPVGASPDAGGKKWIEASPMPDYTGFVKTNDEGNQQDITGGGGLTIDGSIIAAGKVQSGGNPYQGGEQGIGLSPSGYVYGTSDNSNDPVFYGFTTGKTTPNVSILAGGSITASGPLTLGAAAPASEGSVYYPTAVDIRRDDGDAVYSIFRNGATLNDITLQLKSDGSASFAGGAAIISAQGKVEVKRNDSPASNANVNPGFVVKNAETNADAISLFGSGSATFKGPLDVNTAIGGQNVLRLESSGDSSYGLMCKAGGSGKNNYYCDFRNQSNESIFKIDGNGLATFSSTVQVGGNPFPGTGTGFAAYQDGSIALSSASSTGTILFGYTAGNSTPTVILKGSGSADFADTIVSGDSTFATPYAYMSKGGIGLLANAATPKLSLLADGSATFVGDPSGGANNGFQIRNTGEVVLKSSTTDGFTVYGSGSTKAVRLVSNGDGVFTGSVTANGKILTRNVELQTEADDDTKYTATTDSEGNVTRVYNGAVLDVKERLQTKTAALEAIKAAAEDASITTLADFKSAIATALANI